MSSYKEQSDHELLDLLRDNDQQAFVEIYDRYAEVLHRYAYKWLQDRDEVKDVIQDIFTMIWTKRDTISFNHNLSGYLYISVRNSILRKIEQEGRLKNYTSSISEHLLHGVNITDHLIREKQLKAIIEEEVSKLPEKMRMVFELSRNGFLTHLEIAQQLGISELTVRTHIKKALKILRNRLGILMFLYLLMQ